MMGTEIFHNSCTVSVFIANERAIQAIRSRISYIIFNLCFYDAEAFEIRIDFRKRHIAFGKLRINHNRIGYF